MKRSPDSRSRPQGKGPYRTDDRARDSRKAAHYPSIFQPSPFSEVSRRKRAKERRRRTFAGWPSRLLVFVAIALSAASLIAFLPQFHIEKIRVTGLRTVDEEGVQKFAKSREGSHFLEGVGGSARKLFSLRYGSLEDQIIHEYSMIRAVDVRFRYPSQMVIAVEEKVEVLAVRVSGGYALIDRDHEVLRVSGTTDFPLPVLEGVSTHGDIVKGEVLHVEDPEQLVAASHLIAGMIQHDHLNRDAPHLMEAVRQLRQISGPLFILFIPLSQGGEIRVRLEDNRLLPEKLSLLAHLLERGDIIPPVAGELDLSGEIASFKPDTGGSEGIE